jgi:hypothetical protein
MTTHVFSQAPSPPDSNLVEDAGLAGFLAEAKRQESRVDELLTARRTQDVREEQIRSVDITDPELKKNLRTFRRLITGAVGLCERARRTDDGMLVSRVAELKHRIRLPSDKPLTLPLLLTHRFALEQVLAELGDETYLRTRAAELFAEPPGSNATWGTLFKSGPPLFVDGQPAPPEALGTTRAMVAELLAAKEALDLPLRARRELKERILIRYVLPAVVISAIAFGLTIVLTGMLPPQTLAVSVTAAVTGAVLGRLLKLRDEVTRGSQVREFTSLFFAQAAVGLITGLFVSVAADQLKLLDVSTRNGLATISFAAGFSEAAFLGLVSKITGESDTKARSVANRLREDGSNVGSSAESVPKIG